MTDENEIQEETGDPSVPTELLEMHVLLEETGMTPDQFKEAFGDASDQ